MNKVLIFLTTYNGSDYLSQQLNSIIEQQDVKVTISIQDDCSDNSTKNLLRKYEKKDNIIVNFNKKNSGGAAKNFYKLFKNSSVEGFDYIALCDQDDIWEKDKLIKSILKLSESRAQGLSTSVKCFDNEKYWIAKQCPNVKEFDYLFEGGGQGCTFMFNQAAFKQFKNFLNHNEYLYEEFFFHDWLIYLFFRVNGLKWYFYDYASVNYRQHNTNEIGAQGSEKSIFRRFKLIQSGWYSKQVRFALEISKKYHKGRNFTHIYNVFSKKKSILRTFELSLLILLKGRRKIRDRLVLIFSCVMGYL